jgi:5-(carboxyamino)imidazole ribonucleotide mutase
MKRVSKRKPKNKITNNKSGSKIPVAILMGSDSDLPVMRGAAEALKIFGISYKMSILSAHRTPKEMTAFADRAHRNGFQVLIAGAGGAAHLPGMVASLSPLPVIGVPVSTTDLKGLDSLLSVVQMPKGVPVATVAVNNAFNAGLLAAQILSASDPKRAEELQTKLIRYKENLRKMVLKKKLPSR